MCYHLHRVSIIHGGIIRFDYLSTVFKKGKDRADFPKMLRSLSERRKTKFTEKDSHGDLNFRTIKLSRELFYKVISGRNRIEVEIT